MPSLPIALATLVSLVVAGGIVLALRRRRVPPRRFESDPDALSLSFHTSTAKARQGWAAFWARDPFVQAQRERKGMAFGLYAVPGSESIAAHIAPSDTLQHTRLRVSAVDFEAAVIRVIGGKGPHGGKHRTVPMTPQLARMLRAYATIRERTVIDVPEFFLGTRGAEALSDITLRRLFDQISRVTGIHVSPHMLRHTFCTLLSKFGVPGPAGAGGDGARRREDAAPVSARL